ncbi:MAG: hypothetical protein RL410_1074 [Actinomycetota bacterium]
MSTIAFVHAHPDDEALLTAGTMRALFERGHRVVLVMATDGAAGLSSADMKENLADIRKHELSVSAHVLGVAHTYWLGFADSGLDGHAQASRSTLCEGNLEEQVSALRQIFAQERPDVVVSYDKAGGYGHPDHVRVHDITLQAAQESGVPTLLEATMDRQTIARVLDFVRPLIKFAHADDILKLADGFSARADIGYVIDIRRWISPKRAALRAHSSQTTGGSTPRTISVMLAIPRPLFVKIFSREWYRVVWKQQNAFDELPRFN